MKLHVAIAAFAATLAAPLPAFAEQAFFANGIEDGAQSAFVMDGAGIARRVYVDMPCPAEPFWARIDAEDDEVVYVVLGVPALDELRDYRPTLYLLGPDLPSPASRPPWQIPSGYGAIVLPTDDIEDPHLLRDPTTGADSWVLVERRHVLTRGGPYYVVVASPQSRGRFWIRSGTQHVPGGDPDTLVKLRPFFDPTSAPGLGSTCAELRASPGGGGCAIATGGSTSSWAATGAGLALVLAARRRRLSVRA